MKNLISPESIGPEALSGKTVAVIGYGNQGRPQALNLRDSGFTVVIGQRSSGTGYEKAREDGFDVLSIADAVQQADIFMLTLPDQLIPEIFQRDVWPSLREGQTMLFSHGFAVHFGLIVPPLTINVALAAPKGAGTGVRRLYQQGSGVPGLVAVQQDATGNAQAIALSYLWGLGCGRQFVLRTSFEEETVTDLFGEQAVLCGGLPALVEAGFNVLVQAGYAPEIAYFECLHETKLIVDLMVERGLSGMREAISDTAEWGGTNVGPRLVDSETQSRMRAVLAEIQSGQFAAEWMLEGESGSKNLMKSREATSQSLIEQVGNSMRNRMASHTGD